MFHTHGPKSSVAPPIATIIASRTLPAAASDVFAARNDGHAGQDEHRADRDARQRHFAAHDRLERRAKAGQCPAPAPLIGAASPEDGEADGRQYHRPPEITPEPEAGDPEEDDQSGHDEPDPQGLATGRHPDRSCRCLRCRCLLEGCEEPREQVDDDPEAERDREADEARPHDVRLHAQVVADAAGDSRDHAVRSAPLEASPISPGLGRAIARVHLRHARHVPTPPHRITMGDNPERSLVGSGSIQGHP
ncbi:MAG: hypothetical protein M3406_02395 [Chloroflexota bacterium]|nr:hypothetical protein [Chloroflexota bacterium]